MAQIIPFPCTDTLARQAVGVAVATLTQPEENSDFPVVRSLRGNRRVPKQNREEDQETIMFARMAASYSEKAYALARTEPDSKQHRLMVHMVGIADKLPRNNLRVFSTPEDNLIGIWRMWRKVNISNLEWRLAEEIRLDALHSGDADSKRVSSERLEKADAVRWLMFERLIRIPCDSLTNMKYYKLDRRFGTMSDMKFLRKHKPDLAAVLDEEAERLTREKLERKARREAKKQETVHA